ncbi:helix-turn-helix domain-containing protein [Sphingobacterium corticibacterium]|uniref:Helix-turn-helix domain-containing protein n=1 Tax=Sphingobacterium corticibacterium TaxID=2484746 RepID=A0A4Q6XND4_9SPHI|nr:helix-turn-helix domain-containing protein [Sphingobacterium corticibacterium]RZF61663.1 helix-turn-helix domain-containing protein [Sphingobacterium corticibacterium]
MIKKARLLFFYALTFTTITCAQDLDAYNTLYVKTYLETSQKDFSRALHIADSLYTISKTPLLQARSLMLTASLYQQVGEPIKAIEYAIKAEKIIGDTKEVNWKTRIYGFLATQYRIAGLFTPAKEYAEKALTVVEKVKDLQIANATKGLVMQEMAYYEMAHKHYEQAIAYIRQSAQYLENAGQDQSFAVMGNEQLLGLNNYLLGNDEKALVHFKTALHLSTNLPDNHVTALIHNGLANIYISQNELPKAKLHLDTAQRIAGQSHYLQLKKEVNETAYRYYSSTNDINQIRTIKRIQDSIVTRIYRQSADFLNSSYTILGREREGIRRELNSKLLFFITGILIVLPFTLYFFLPQPKQKHRAIHLPAEKRNESTNKEDTPSPPLSTNGPLTPSDIHTDPDSEPSSQPVISEQTVDKILAELEEFESKQLYVRRDLSLSYLATYCDTNAKYLSVVINSHKKKDFFNYINELRINYIIEKLRNDPYYRRLKIAVLAREAGFSSQSKFALNFKKVTDVSPSEFIKSLAEGSEV